MQITTANSNAVIQYLLEGKSKGKLVRLCSSAELDTCGDLAKQSKYYKLNHVYGN